MGRRPSAVRFAGRLAPSASAFHAPPGYASISVASDVGVPLSPSRRNRLPPATSDANSRTDPAMSLD